MAASDTGQKTEKPTPKRLQEARKKGQIPRSADLVSWSSLLVASFVIPTLLRGLNDQMRQYFDRVTQAADHAEWGAAMEASSALAVGTVLVLLPFLGLLMLLSALGLAVQGGVTLTLQPLRPKLERISIKAGVKRLFSAQAAVDTLKAVVRLVALVAIVTQVAFDSVERYLSGTGQDLAKVGPELGAALLLVVRLAAVLGIVVGVADYFFQRWKTMKQLRMSAYDIKQERRNTEGDQMIRGRRRSMHQKLSRNQMLAAVQDASVVVVNPTHYSVALSYAAGQVPTVVAKGVDDLAFRIRERAFEHHIPVVESRALARLMHDTIEVGEEVPAELYEAIAIVIAFVMQRPPGAFGDTVRQVNVPESKLVRPTALKS